MTSQALRCLVVAVAGVSVLVTAVGMVDATLYRRNVASMGGGGGGGGGLTGGDMAAPKYDSGGYQSSGYSSGGGAYGGGGGGYGGGGGGGYGGGGYGGGGGGGYDALDVGVEVKQEYENAAKTQASNGGGGGGQTYDTGNVYYYYYPTQTKSDDHASSYSPSQSSYNSYPPLPPPPPPAAYPMYYPMQDDKDKDDGGILGGLVGLGIPAVLAVLLGIPLLLLGLLAAGAALAFFIGRSNDGGYLLSAAFKDDYDNADGVSPHLPGAITNLSLVRAVHEAFAAYTALSTDESCRQRVVCELGYVLKASEASKGTIISVFDAVMPSSWQHQFKPLKEVLLSGESGKCQKYVCDAAAAALKRGPLKTILGDRHKGAAAGTPVLVKATLNPDNAAAYTSTPSMPTNAVNATDQYKNNTP